MNIKNIINNKLLLCCLFVALSLLSGCASNRDDPGLPSPCVGIDGSPCVRRPANRFLI